MKSTRKSTGIKLTIISLSIIWIVSLLLLGMFFLHQRGVFFLGWEKFPVSKNQIIKKGKLGPNAYLTVIPRSFTKIIAQSHHSVVIYEDDIPLPVYRKGWVGRYRVGRDGLGYFHIQNRRVFFSATDNSDPRLNNKRYDLRVPRPVDVKTYRGLGVFALLCSCVLLILIIWTGNIYRLGRITLILGCNLFIFIILITGVEIFLRIKTHTGNPQPLHLERRLPYDSNYALKDPTYYRPEEVLDESHGLYTWGILIEKNRFGFRERDFNIPKPPGTFRVMVVGDSLTFGIGLPNEKRFTNLAEARLKDLLPGRKIEILNFGSPGADLDDEIEILKNYSDQVQPDYIVVAFCSNDLMASIDLYKIRKTQFDTQYGSSINYILAKMRKVGLSATALVASQALEGFLIATGILPNVDSASELLLKDNSPEISSFEKGLRKVKQISDTMSLPIPVIVFLNQNFYNMPPSDYHDLNPSLPVQMRIIHKAEQLAEDVGLQHYNHEKEIYDGQPFKMAINDVDGHPSAELNQIYANKLANFLFGLLSR